MLLKLSRETRISLFDCKKRPLWVAAEQYCFWYLLLSSENALAIYWGQPLVRLQVWKDFRTITKVILVSFSKQISSVRRQKGKTQNGGYKKTKHVKFSEKQTLFTPCMHSFVGISGDKRYLILENLACFVFLYSSLWDLSFCLATDDISSKLKNKSKNLIW